MPEETREQRSDRMNKELLSLKADIIKNCSNSIINKIKKSGTLTNYKIVWNQLESIVCPVIKSRLEKQFPGCKITITKSKSTYPDIKIEYSDLRFAIDIKSSESSKDPWYDIARLDTIESTRLAKYDEEYELLIKYDSNTRKLIEIYFMTLREAVGIRIECQGVKYRPYDGKLRPKSWTDFASEKVYWDTKEKFLEGIRKSKRFRLQEMMKKHAKNLNYKEKEEYREIFK